MGDTENPGVCEVCEHETTALTRYRDNSKADEHRWLCKFCEVFGNQHHSPTNADLARCMNILLDALKEPTR